MIASDKETSAKWAADYSSAADFSALPSELAELCFGLKRTIDDPAFPGALVPIPVANGAVEVAAVTETSSDWRRLTPVLVAFCGPTLSSFDGLPQPLNGNDEVSQLIASAYPAATGLLRFPADLKGQLAGLRALQRARETLAGAPVLQGSAPEPTSWLLARFQDHLNVGRREAAVAILGRLRDELRLDALNLKFLEVQLLARFEEWRAIVALPGFGQLCRARRPSAISALLLEALFEVELRSAFEAEDQAALQRIYQETVRGFASPILTLPVPPSLGPGGWKLFALGAVEDPDRLELRHALEGRGAELGWIARLLSGTSDENVAVDEPQSTPLDEARAALAETEAVDSLDALGTALASIERLSSEDLERLKTAEPFRSLLQAVQSVRPGGALPRNWQQWLVRAADEDFQDAAAISRQGAEEWAIGTETADPIVVQRFVAALDQAQTSDLAAERVSQALPFIVAWLRRDPEFPRPAFAPIFASLLTLFAMNAARGRPIYESSQILIYGLLASGLSEKDYRTLLDDVDELAGPGFGVEMIYWLLEIIEDLIRFGAADPDARDQFLHSALARVTPIQARLTSLQRAAISRLAAELGWDAGTFEIAKTPTTTDDLSTRLADLKIAIYTLTESSGRQAKAALQEAAPSIKVDCNSDHGGTARLRALAENSDLFVLTSLSAKHAATDFIREHRGNQPLLYAQGRGFSSILRAIEDHLLPSTRQ